MSSSNFGSWPSNTFLKLLFDLFSKFLEISFLSFVNSLTIGKIKNTEIIIKLDKKVLDRAPKLFPVALFLFSLLILNPFFFIFFFFFLFKKYIKRFFFFFF